MFYSPEFYKLCYLHFTVFTFAVIKFSLKESPTTVMRF